jgi:CheY-like chemotaxis protein
VFGFAKQSGGEVMVESEVGVGSVFTLYLPKVSAPAGESARVIEEATPLVEGHGTRVLVVEDNADVGSFAVQSLTDLGYVPLLASNGEQALAELELNADRFDVVFTDVVMPGMNGIDLARTVQERFRHLPVLLASGYSHVLAQSGTNGFELLQKPYSVDQLARLLGKVIARHTRQRTACDPMENA